MAKTNSKTAPRAYLLRGDDDYQKQKALQKLLQILVSPDFADFDLEQLEGDSATSDRIISGVSMPPFTSTKRVVVVKHANKMPEQEQQKLAAQLVKIPESGCLILVNPAAEKVENRVRKGSEVIGDLSRAVRKVGEVQEFGKMKAGDAIKFAQSLFATANKKIDSSTLAALVQRVGSDSSVISVEVEKLLSYTYGSDSVTRRDVEDITSETPEEKIFKLIDGIGARKPAIALSMLRELMDAGHDPSADAPRTLAMIARQLRLIWQAKLLMESGARAFTKDAVPDDVKEMLPSDPNVLDLFTRQAWQRDKILSQAKSFSKPALERAFTAIAQADMMLKSIDGNIEDPETIMELLVIELCGSSEKSRAGY